MNTLLLVSLYLFLFMFVVIFFVLVQPKDLFNIKFKDYTKTSSECF